jgi:hypothetical protein
VGLPIAAVLALAAPAPAEEDPPAPRAFAGRDLARDVLDLVEGGGRMPRPSAPAASLEDLGRFLVRHLARLDDPARGADSRRLLEIVAHALARGPGANPSALAAASIAADPEDRPLLEGLLAGAERPPGPPRRAFPAVLGASVRPGLSAHGPAVEMVEVPAGSLAAEAGLRPGDLVVAVDGLPIGPEVLPRLLEAGRPGSQLSLRVQRKEGAVEEWDLSFEAAPASNGDPPDPDEPAADPGRAPAGR